ncbi:hypothetical protein ACFWB0_22085 [Rhodococcus sp. NPDC060086]|uniref:hypothetical protein n=1 Tax=Rhodococcus sp. NPDC060086 TaxID=3347055 RepID=UPI003660812D
MFVIDTITESAIPLPLAPPPPSAGVRAGGPEEFGSFAHQLPARVGLTIARSTAGSRATAVS